MKADKFPASSVGSPGWPTIAGLVGASGVGKQVGPGSERGREASGGRKMIEARRPASTEPLCV